MEPSLSYLCGLASMTFVTASVVVAAVRWFHMCKPYDSKPDYYYPARPFVTGVWLCALALLPYVLHPESGDAWFLARVYFLPVTLFHFVLLLLSYFGTIMEWKWWKAAMSVAGIPVALALLVSLVLAIWPGEQIAGWSSACVFLYGLGSLVTVLCIVSSIIVYSQASRLDQDNYSNPDDFPVKQALRWLFLFLTDMLLCWVGVLLNSPAVLAAVQLLLAASCVVFLISALHPNRNRPVGELEQAEVSDPDASSTDSSPVVLYKRVLSKQKQEEMLSTIITVVEKQKAYLDPHLTLQDVADRCGYSRTYVAGLIKSELGGFFHYVNRLRLAHADRLKAENPGIPVGEMIDASGFGSYTTYYKIRRQLQEANGDEGG